MIVYSFLQLQDLYESKARANLVEATQAMEPRPIYADVKHVPAMIEECERQGSDLDSAKEIVRGYFAMNEKERDLAYPGDF